MPLLAMFFWQTENTIFLIGSVSKRHLKLILIASLKRFFFFTITSIVVEEVLIFLEHGCFSLNCDFSLEPNESSSVVSLLSGVHPACYHGFYKTQKYAYTDSKCFENLSWHNKKGEAGS